MKKITFILFGIIFLLGLLLRIYKLDNIPPSLNWDETAAAYNAYSISKWGMDEWGEKFPLVFKSFRDDKYPVHIYSTAIIYFLTGNTSDYVTRTPSVFVGLLAILGIFLISKYIFKSNIAGLMSSLALSVSAYHVHYSRGLWEANFAVSLLIFAIGIFAAGIRKYQKLIPVSYLLFGLSLISYHSSKIVVPVVVLLITILYLKNLYKYKKNFLLSLGIFMFFIALHIIEPRLLGLARIDQNTMDQSKVSQTFLYQRTQNKFLGQIEYSLRDLKYYLSREYLFVKGSPYPRSSVGKGGMFTYTVIVLSIIGVISMIVKKKFDSLIILIAWFILAPIPAVFAGGETNATRAIFMLGPPEVASGFGFVFIINMIKRKYFKVFISIVIISSLFLELFPVYKYYFEDYSKNEAIQWQYGMKEVVDFISNNPEYDEVYVTKLRSQPYIFFLHYLNYPLPKLLVNVKYDQTGSASYNTIESFDKFHFGSWNYFETEPIKGRLYVVTANEYGGFTYNYLFTKVETIKFPRSKEIAFYIVTAI